MSDQTQVEGTQEGGAGSELSAEDTLNLFLPFMIVVLPDVMEPLNDVAAP